MGLKEKIEYLTDIDDIFKSVRLRRYIKARAMYACYRVKIQGGSPSEVAREMGYPSHASVIHLNKQYHEVKDSLEWKLLVNSNNESKATLGCVKDNLSTLKDVTGLLIQAKELGALKEAKQKIELIIKIKQQLKR